ncbi:hypothetical protein OSK51_29835, partial [Escherichia coli]|nr:hypothetical protein [Escherichia coli]
TVSSSGSEPENNDFTRYFVSRGCAVLCTAGMPESYSERLQVDHTRCLGRFSGLSIEKAHRELGYQPRTLEEGIKQMFGW